MTAATVSTAEAVFAAGGLRAAAEAARERRAAERAHVAGLTEEAAAAHLRMRVKERVAVVLGRHVRSDEVRVGREGDALVARVEVQGLPFEGWVVRDGTTDLRLRLTCPECGRTLVTGPSIRCLADLGDALAAPPEEAAPCGDCLDLTHGPAGGEV